MTAARPRRDGNFAGNKSAGIGSQATPAGGVDAGRASHIQLEAIAISRRFGDFQALEDISIGIEKGEFLTLLGPSGSGKSTFLNILAGFDAPSSGKLVQGGEDVTHRPAEQRNFGMVFQGYALFPHLTVAGNVSFPLRVRKVPSADRSRRVAQVLESVGLTAHADKLPRQLSGGQQQRVALARALVFSPDILLLDEPLSALDKTLREQLQIELQRIHREFRTTFVFVTHDQSEALALSSRVAIFNHGRLMQVGKPADVYTRPGSRFVAEFLGQVNLFPLGEPGSAGGIVAGRFGDRLLTAPGHAAGPVVLGVRPEHMSLSVAEPSGLNAVQAVIDGVAYHGATVLLSLHSSGGAGDRSLSLTIPAEMWARDSAQWGQSVWLAWQPEHGMILPRE
ncbi:ABC transporter ATP-binding protein [Labrys monachus]|uniref:Spermidine/putrescine transport system ATP-binding protein n=1 Tax=Labrys monachus TaxID=217067 RepID=A0ABU0F6K8_9HYPH|nr:ABC transporter ATP-binding protein [Labrys monachus]MDQ0390253.1 putative spermidine/putrescine transport system ATP-binding protein [Labrys monachus]